jgi:hypothetical protein
MNFHDSVVSMGGRRGGASAFELKPRELSKKQKKRNTAKRREMMEKRDPAKEKLQENVLRKQMTSNEMSKYVSKANDR